MYLFCHAENCIWTFFHFSVAVCTHLILHSSSAKHWKRMSQLTYRLQQFYCQINFRISICMTWELREHRSLFYARDLQKLLLFFNPGSNAARTPICSQREKLKTGHKISKSKLFSITRCSYSQYLLYIGEKGLLQTCHTSQRTKGK